jgi:hypothetical protein
MTGWVREIVYYLAGILLLILTFIALVYVALAVWDYLTRRLR